MKKQILILLILGLGVSTSCNQDTNAQLSDFEVWKLGWRMIASSMDENYELANMQFDSLWNSTHEIDRKFVVTGLEVKNRLGKTEEMIEILETQDDNMLQEICLKPFISTLQPCDGVTTAVVTNKELQIELIKMYVDDQAVRGNLMQDIIGEYDVDPKEIYQGNAMFVDERNRNRLKEIFEKHGFPTKDMVGKDAMNGIFLMIQHSDRDKVWQKSQLANIEMAVKNGDMDGQSYAYLYDRIKINSGEKQLYGTQFSNVDPANKMVELAETEDLENLDQRRMEIGMMPIKMYKEFMLKNL